MNNCPTIKSACKPAGAERRIEIDVYDYCARTWRDNEDVDTDETWLPSTPTGYALKALAPGGRTGVSEPRWPRTLGAIVTDGSVTWRVVEAAANGLNAASDPTATVSPSGMTADSALVVESRKIELTYAGGTAGVDYEVTIGFLVDGRRQYIRQTVSVT